MHQLSTLWHNLPWIIRLPIDFYFIYIFMRGIVAKDITSWLEDRGFIKKKEQSIIYRSLDFVYFHAQRLIPNFDRHAAIWNHYKNGHQHQSVLGCGKDQCTIF